MGAWVHGCMGAWVGEWVSGWVSGWMNGWMSGWMSGWVGEWVSGWVGEWVIRILDAIKYFYNWRCTASHEIPTEIINSGANPIRGVIGAEGGLGLAVGGPSRAWLESILLKRKRTVLRKIKLLQNIGYWMFAMGWWEAGWMGRWVDDGLLEYKICWNAISSLLFMYRCQILLKPFQFSWTKQFSPVA